MRGIMTKVYLPTYRNGQFERLQQQTHKANNFIISMNFIVSRRQQLEKNKDAGQQKKNQRTHTLLNNLANTKKKTFMELVFAVFSFNAVFVLQILFLKVIISSKSHSYRKEAVAFLVFRNWHLWQVLT